MRTGGFVALLLAFLFLSAAPIGAAEGVTYQYLLSKPANTTVELGPVARAMYPLSYAAITVAQVAAIYSQGGEVLGALSYTAYKAVRMPMMIASDSLVDLKLRQTWKRYRFLKRVASIKGVTAIRMITASSIEFKGTMAKRQRNTGYVFVESTRELTAGEPWTAQLGEPIAIANLSNTRVRLTLNAGPVTSPVEWTSTLGEIFAKTSMPDHVAIAWTQVAKALKPEPLPPSAGPFVRAHRLYDQYLNGTHLNALTVVATLVFEDGHEQSLGPLINGRPVLKLLGLTLPARAWRFTKAWFAGVPNTPHGRSLPVCEKLLTGK